MTHKPSNTVKMVGIEKNHGVFEAVFSVCVGMVNLRRKKMRQSAMSDWDVVVMKSLGNLCQASLP